MQFTYKISPFAYLKYYLYRLRWPTLLLPLLICTRFTPQEGQNPVLSYTIYYGVLLFSLLLFVVPIGAILSLGITVGQKQIGQVSTVSVDENGITERWQDKSVFIPWNDVKKKSISRNLILIRTQKTKIHWHMFRSNAGYENFEELKGWIRKYEGV